MASGCFFCLTRLPSRQFSVATVFARTAPDSATTLTGRHSPFLPPSLAQASPDRLRSSKAASPSRPHHHLSALDLSTLVMAFLSSALNIFGAVLLAHAYVVHLAVGTAQHHTTDSVYSVYSAHEHSTLATIAGSLPVAPVHSYIIPTIDLPLDITLETLTAVLLLCVGIVIGSPELKPIQWRVWAGKLEKDKSAKTESINGDPLGPRGNPYAALEQRQGFLDIRSQRNEFADWVKSGSSKK